MNKNQEVDTQAIDIHNKKILLEKQFDITKIKERIERLERENQQLKDEIDQERRDWMEKRKQYRNDIDVRKKESERLKEEKVQIEYNLEMQAKRKKELMQEFDDKIRRKEQEFQLEKSDLEDKKSMLQQKISNIQMFIDQQDDLKKHRQELFDLLEKEKQDKLKELEIKNQEKTEATDKLKKEMLHKIQETKTSLLALKKEQLQTTIRLTVLQNHQLTTELEYQSKQTEKLLFKNQKLQEEITILRRDVEIHKQVEQELAKRSHFSQKLIKKLKNRITELNEDNNEIEKQKQDYLNNQSKKPKDQEEQNKIIEKLEEHIQNVENKTQKINNECEIMKKETEYLQNKIESSDKKYANMGIVIIDTLVNLIGAYDQNLMEQSQQNNNNEDQNQQQIENSQNLTPESTINVRLDLNDLKNIDAKLWTLEQQIGMYVILAHQLIPLIQHRNLQEDLDKLPYINVEIIEDTQRDNIVLPRIESSNSQKRQQQQYNSNNMNINNQDQNNSQKRLVDLPRDISTRIVKSNLRDWQKVSTTMPTTNGKSLAKRFKIN